MDVVVKRTTQPKTKKPSTPSGDRRLRRQEPTQLCAVAIL